MIKAVILFFLLVPDVMAAIPDTFREYITHGNFNVIVIAFERLALLMSDTSFSAYVMIAIITAGLVWGGTGFFNMFRGGRPENFFHGLILIFTGAIVYLFFIVPKSDIIIYDEPSNRHMIVSEVPEGLILLAGIQNKLVNGAINMIWTSTDPLSYRQNARGDIFNIMEQVFKNTSFTPSPDDSTGNNLGLSIQRYFKDCVLFELNRPASNLNVNDFYADASILDVLENSQSSVISTIWYDNDNTAGVAQTCTEAYGKIVSVLNAMAENSGTNKKFWEERCEKAGYYDMEGVDGEPSSRVCREKVVNFLALYLTPENSLNLMKQHMVSQEIFNYIKLNHVDLLADFKISTQLRGEASASLSWLPLIKGVMFAVYIGLTPFMFILLPTLIFPRVVQFIVGIFVFMSAWEVADAILHSYAMDLSVATFRELFNNGLTLKSLWMMEGESHKSLLIFGKMRWASMMLAATLSFVLARFGGVALAHFAGSMGFGHMGAMAADEAINPSQRAGTLTNLKSAAPTEAITNEYSLSALEGQALYHMRAGAGGTQNIIDHDGFYGTGVYAASDRAAEITGTEFLSRSMRAEAIEKISAGRTGGKEQLLRDVEDTSMAGRVSHADAIRDTAFKNDTSAGDLMYDQARSGLERAQGRAAIDAQDWGLTGDTAAQNSLAEKAAYLKGRALDDIKTTGALSPETRGDIGNMVQTGEGAMAFSNAPGSTANLNETEKQNLSRWLKENDYPVNPSALGSQTTMNFRMGENGNVLPSGARSFEGHTGISGFTYASTHGHFATHAITPYNPLTVGLGTNGERVTFIGGKLSGTPGGVMTLSDGLTVDGHPMTGQIHDGQLFQQTFPHRLGMGSGTMLNYLGNNNFGTAGAAILGREGEAIQSFSGAVNTYARQQNFSTEVFSRSVAGNFGVSAGIPGTKMGGGIHGRVGKSWEDTTQFTEDIISTGMRDKLKSATTDREARQIMQEEFNNIFDNLGDETNGKGIQVPDNNLYDYPGGS